MGVSKGYLINLTKGHDKPPTLERLEQISQHLKLESPEKKKLFELAHEERQNSNDLAFQQSIKDLRAADIIEKHGGAAHKELSEESQLVQWNSLYKRSILAPFTKGDAMLRTEIIDEENVPNFIKGDELTIDGSNVHIEDGKLYLFRDGVVRRVILRQVEKYGELAVLRTTNQKVREEFNPKRFEIVGRVTRHIRNL